ncbi:MAG: DUF4838 domain-containing protein, partial [Verrucomicrobia bacterium]|nr:DUF4838 domain-containing protein [Verrucomicrobiota bacterium]
LAVALVWTAGIGLDGAIAGKVKGLSLVQDGKSQYAIVIPDAPTTQEMLAGKELAKYLKQISGADLSITSNAAGRKIVVAQAKDGKGPGGISFTKDETEYDAFVIKTDGADLYLVGSNKRAVIYAVYTFLEKHLGCRWLTYGEIWKTAEGKWMNQIEENVPVSKSISLAAIDDRQKASLKYRGMRANAWYGNTPINIVDWATKNKINTFLMQVPMYMEAEAWNVDVVKNGMIARGAILVVGHHSFRYFLSPDKYFKDHPEWFPLIDGKRIPGHRLNGQFCFSNRDAVKTLRDNFTAFVKEHPEVDIYAPYPTDGYGWCECDLCAKDRPAWEEDPKKGPQGQDQYMRLISQLNEDLQKVRAGKRIGALAYVNYAPPPLKEKPAPGLFLSYSFFTRFWYTVSWGNAKGEVGVGRYPFQLHSQQLQKWIDLTKDNGGEVTLYEYYTDRYSKGVGFYLMHLISDELAYFSKLGAKGCITEVHWSNRKVVPGNVYVYAKKCWDLSASTDDILADYAKSRFGKAAEPMVKYLNEAERYSREFNRYLFLYQHLDQPRDQRDTERNKCVAGCEKYLEEAKALADTDQAKKNIADEDANFKMLKAWQLGK